MMLLGVAARIVLMVTFPEELIVDRDAYIGVAKGVAEGDGFCSPGSTAPTAYRPPAYPVLLGVMLIAVPPVWAVATVNIACFMLTCWVTARLSPLRLTWSCLEWRTTSAIAVWVVSFDLVHIYYSVQPMTETLATLLAVSWVASASGVLRERAASDKAGIYTLYLFWLGAVTGILSLCRPSFLPLVLVAAGFGFVSTYQTDAIKQKLASILRRDRFVQAIRNIVVVLLGATIFLAPWAVRNWYSFGTPILSTTHGGYTLLLANNPVFQKEVVDRGWNNVWQQQSFSDWQEQVEAKLAETLPQPQTEVSRDRAMNKMAIEWMSAHPSDVAKGVLFRWAQFWSMVPQGAERSDVAKWACFFWYALIWGLATIGVIRAIEDWPQRKTWFAPTACLFLVLMGTHAFYWTNARMRAPLTPVIGLLVANAARVTAEAWGGEAPLDD